MLPSSWSANVARAGPDLLRAILKTFTGLLLGAEADAVCGARSEER
ncbi:MAG: IS256 family transposase, partial [Mycobacteriaceae bacterium]